LKTRSDTLHLSARRTQSDVSGNVRERTKKTAFAKTSTVNVSKNAQLQNLNISFPPILNANFDAVNFVATRDKKLRQTLLLIAFGIREALVDSIAEKEVYRREARRNCKNDTSKCDFFSFIPLSQDF